MSGLGCVSPAVRLSEGEVRHRWAALTPQQRRAVLSYSDQDLVEGIRASVRRIVTQSAAVTLLLRCIQKPGASISDIPECETALQQVSSSSKILFRFAFGVSPTDCPNPARTKEKFCMMAVSREFVEDERFFDIIKDILPDFLSKRAKSQGRFPQSPSRWKDLWATSLPTVGAIDIQLCKLIEQSLWDMGSSPTFEVMVPGALLNEEAVRPIEGELSIPTSRPSGRKNATKAKAKAPIGPEADGCGEEKGGNCRLNVEASGKVVAEMDQRAEATPASDVATASEAPSIACREKLSKSASRKERARKAKLKASAERREDAPKDDQIDDECGEETDALSEKQRMKEEEARCEEERGEVNDYEKELTDSRSHASTEIQSDAESPKTTPSSADSTPRVSLFAITPEGMSIGARLFRVTEKNTFLHVQEDFDEFADCETTPSSRMRLRSCPPRLVQEAPVM